MANTTNSVTTLRAGQAGPFRWRGPRQSAPLLSLAEGVISDCTSLLRRLYWLRAAPGCLPGAVPSVGAPASPMSDLAATAPRVWEAHATRIQSLRRQADFLTNNPFS